MDKLNQLQVDELLAYLKNLRNEYMWAGLDDEEQEKINQVRKEIRTWHKAGQPQNLLTPQMEEHIGNFIAQPPVTQNQNPLWLISADSSMFLDSLYVPPPPEPLADEQKASEPQEQVMPVPDGPYQLAGSGDNSNGSESAIANEGLAASLINPEPLPQQEQLEMPSITAKPTENSAEIPLLPPVWYFEALLMLCDIQRALVTTNFELSIQLLNQLQTFIQANQGLEGGQSGSNPFYAPLINKAEGEALVENPPLNYPVPVEEFATMTVTAPVQPDTNQEVSSLLSTKVAPIPSVSRAHSGQKLNSKQLLKRGQLYLKAGLYDHALADFLGVRIRGNITPELSDLIEEATRLNLKIHEYSKV